MKSRIAIFSGYASPFGRPSTGRYGGHSRMGRPSLGRRSYYVPLREESMADSRRPYRYEVKAKRNTPAMKRAMNRFSKAAKSCSRKTAKRGSFQQCMSTTLRKKGKR